MGVKELLTQDLINLDKQKRKRELLKNKVIGESHEIQEVKRKIRRAEVNKIHVVQMMERRAREMEKKIIT